MNNTKYIKQQEVRFILEVFILCLYIIYYIIFISEIISILKEYKQNKYLDT